MIRWFPGLMAMLMTAGGSLAQEQRPFVIVLGIAQDAGYPQAGCLKECCAPAWPDPSKRRFPSCLAIVDPKTDQRWLLDCTPAFPEQLRLLDRLAPVKQSPGITGILLTHAHIGHYTGLMHLGREAMGADMVPVHTMPRMRTFLTTNGPWSLLVEARHIELHGLKDGEAVRLNDRITVTPILVPHRDEFSETVCFKIEGPERSVLYLPDIDKWDRWETRIEEVLAGVDRAYLDGTFFADGELPGRDMSKIPHPFVSESIRRFADLPKKERGKVRFIHLNHTNPLLRHTAEAIQQVEDADHGVAEQGERFPI